MANWDALQTSFLDQVTKLAELAVADEALEKTIAAARVKRQVRTRAYKPRLPSPPPPSLLVSVSLSSLNTGRR